MANTNAPFGFRPIGLTTGATPNFQQKPYKILYSNSNKIGQGDLVFITSGYVDTALSTTHPVLGVFAGCQYVSTITGQLVNRNYWAGGGDVTSTTVITAFVYDDPTIIYEGQVSGAAVTIANIEQNIKIVAGTPNPLSGFSTAAFDSANIANTSTYPFRIYALGNGFGNGYDSTSSYNRIQAVLNDQYLKDLTSL